MYGGNLKEGFVDLIFLIKDRKKVKLVRVKLMCCKNIMVFCFVIMFC